MKAHKNDDVVFQHLIDLPRCNCVLASARERLSGKRRLFLFQNENNQIFKRNSLCNSWDELREENDIKSLRNGFIEEIRQRRIPCFQAPNLDVFSVYA